MLNVQDLRKIFSAQGIKGFSSANRAAFTAAIDAAHAEALELDAARTPVVEAPAPKKGVCGICGNRRSYSGKGNGVEDAPRLSDMCNFCFTEGGWENTHSDANHGDILATPEAERTEGQNLEISACWICHPEFNLVNKVSHAGRSRVGMVIVAKGSEIHKSETFRVAAEAAGWTVNVLGYVTEDEGDEEERYVATATKGDDTIELAWNGRAYDYPASGATFGGKARKVRNLKEALRLL